MARNRPRQNGGNGRNGGNRRRDNDWRSWRDANIDGHRIVTPTAAAGGPSAPAPTAAAAGGGLSTTQQSAFDYMRNLLGQMGLGSLADTLQRLILQGITDEASLTLQLQETQEWKTRFAGNERLRQAGLPVLSVAEYLSVERSFAQVMKNYGLPTGFYDDPADFAGWIGNSVSANELQQRVGMYADLVNREDPAIKDQLRSMGMSEGDILAYTMDPTRATPLIQKKYQTALIGGAARRAGVVGDNAYLEQLAARGITEEQAGQGYGMVAESLDTMTRLGDIYGESITQRDLESEVFESNADAAGKRKRLASRERAAFSGSSGITQGSLSQSTGGQY